MQAGPGVGPGLVLGAGADEAEHRGHRQTSAVAPVDPAVADGDNAVLVADPEPPSQAGKAPLPPRKRVNPTGSRTIRPTCTVRTMPGSAPST